MGGANWQAGHRGQTDFEEVGKLEEQYVDEETSLRAAHRLTEMGEIKYKKETIWKQA